MSIIQTKRQELGSLADDVVSDRWSPRPAKRARQLRVSVFLAFVFTIALISPLVSYVGHGLILAWTVFPFWALMALAENRSLGRRILPELTARRFELVAFTLWFLLIGANTVLGRSYAGIIHLEIMGTIGMLLFMDLVYTARQDGSREMLLTMVIVWAGAESARAIPTLWSVPLLPRYVMVGGPSTDAYVMAMKASVGEYGLYTGLAMALPFMLALALSKRHWLKVVLLLACATIPIAISLATLLGAIVLTIGGIILLIVSGMWHGKKKLRALALGAAVVALGGFIWFGFLGDSEQGQMMLEKLNLQVSSVSDRGIIRGDVTLRGDLWLNSIDTFLNNPLLGVGPTFGILNPNLGYVVGGHSSWLDTPAEYGILGMALYLSFILGVMRRTVKAQHGKRDLIGLARIVGCLLFLLGGAYNPVVFIPQVNVFLLLVVLGGVPSSSVRKPILARSMS